MSENESKNEHSVSIKVGDKILYEGDSSIVRGVVVVSLVGISVGAAVVSVALPLYVCYYAGRYVKMYAYPLV